MAPETSCPQPWHSSVQDASAGPRSWSGVPTIEDSWSNLTAAVNQVAALDEAPLVALAPSSIRPNDSINSLSLDSIVPKPNQPLAAARKYGGFTLAYNTAVQDGLEYFWSGDGYIAYRSYNGYVFVLGDPVAQREQVPQLLREFLARFRKPTFVQISSSTAAELVKCGYYINEMGVDTCLDLPQYSFAGKSMERIRYASNWLKKHGYTITESTYSETSTDEALAVTNGWRDGMKCRKAEMQFLNRPIRYEDEPDVRKFFLREASGRCVAFFYFDPLYRAGQVVGYATAIKRRLPDAPIYAEQGLMKFAVEQFKGEGIEQVNLGLSPLAWIENKTFRRNPFLHHSFRYAFRAWWVNRFFYNLEGHALYKRHFKGREEPFHYASPVLFNDLRIFNLMRLTGVC
ncbi:MAG: DUF2156 domain-containing protein [Planctomycetaceae bacterium]|nr:DUF2156 domain-containing protein [Planctomycetaceae bacterium]